jgi:holo-[acyl-carrier protein] synthase
MIVGMGMDLVSISRIDAILHRPWGPRFELRIFSEPERTYCRGRGDPAQHYAARFAAKEATLKALGVPLGLGWHEMEVLRGPGGLPQLVLSGAAAAVSARRGVTKLHITLTHANDVAGAVVILEK